MMKRYRPCTCYTSGTCPTPLSQCTVLVFLPGTAPAALFMRAKTNAWPCSPSTVIDATRTGNDARYMAHSQDPNCQCQKWVVDNQPRAFMVALRDIAPGEELTYNYYRQCSLGEQVRSAHLL